MAGIRSRVCEYCQDQSPLKGEIEVDESYFGSCRVRGKRGRGARGKTIVFDLLKKNKVKFKGMDKKMFNLHLKECEFRFNHRGENMYQILLKLFRYEPLKLSLPKIN